jgi:penicillin-binding protein 2
MPNMEIVAAIEENKDWMPGIEVSVESKRLYHDDCHMAHTLGYAREITETQLQKKGDYYQKGDIIGTTGLESTYEEFLRGTKGVEFVAVNAAGQRVESFRDGNNDLLSEEGFDLYSRD